MDEKLVRNISNKTIYIDNKTIAPNQETTLPVDTISKIQSLFDSNQLSLVETGNTVSNQELTDNVKNYINELVKNAVLQYQQPVKNAAAKLDTYTKNEMDNLLSNKSDKSALTNYTQKTDLDSYAKKTDMISTHDKLTGLNDDPSFMHVTQSQLTEFLNYDARIQALESGTIDPAPTITNSTVNGSTTVSSVLSQLTFTVSGTKTLSLDTTKITCNPSGIIGTPTLDTTTLTVPLKSMKGNTSYTVTIGTGAIKNGTTSNSSDVVCSFKTAASTPAVTNSALNGNTTVDSATLSNITFTVSGDGNLVLADSTKITCSPNIINGTITLASNQLTIPVTNAQYSTNYTVTIGAGAITNDGIANTAINCLFKTVASAPVITNSTLNGNTTVDSATLSNITFAISGSGTLAIADSTKITCSPNIINGTITLASNQLTIPVTGVAASTNYTVTIGAGAIKDDAITNTTAITCTFTTKAAGQVEDWHYDFILPNAIYEYNLLADNNFKAMGKTFTLNDVYGANLDGVATNVKLFFAGYASTVNPNPTSLKRVPLSIETGVTAPNDNGAWDYDDSTGLISWAGGGPSNRQYRIVKYK